MAKSSALKSNATRAVKHKGSTTPSTSSMPPMTKESKASKPKDKVRATMVTDREDIFERQTKQHLTWTKQDRSSSLRRLRSTDNWGSATAPAVAAGSSGQVKSVKKTIGRHRSAGSILRFMKKMEHSSASRLADTSVVGDAHKVKAKCGHGQDNKSSKSKLRPVRRSAVQRVQGDQKKLSVNALLGTTEQDSMTKADVIANIEGGADSVTISANVDCAFQAAKLKMSTCPTGSPVAPEDMYTTPRKRRPLPDLTPIGSLLASPAEHAQPAEPPATSAPALRAMEEEPDLQDLLMDMLTQTDADAEDQDLHA